MNILDHCLTLSEEAYKQEEESEKILREKVDYLFKWLSFLVSVFNIAVPLIASNGIEQKKWFLPMYLVLLLFLMIALVLTIIMQYPKKMKRYPLGSTVLKRIQGDEKYQDEKYNIYQSILYRDALTKKLAENNKSTAKKMSVVCFFLVIGIIGMAIFFSLIILNI